MSIKVNVHEAKTNLSNLLERVISGEEIIIARAGKPIAKLVPLIPKAARRLPGNDRGRVVIKPDFDEPLPEFEQL